MVFKIKLAQRHPGFMEHGLLESYLSNRKQFVQLGEMVSQVKPISMGVPQGSVIGPKYTEIVGRE